MDESEEIRHRRERADVLRHQVLERLEALGGRRVQGRQETRAALLDGVELILSPRLDDDLAGARRAQPHALVRVARHDDTFRYVPLLIRNIEFADSSTTRFLDASSLDDVASRATSRVGAVPRSSQSVTRSVFGLAHATRVLQALRLADPSNRVVLVDRHQRAWWWSLSDAPHQRLSFAAYDEAYEERFHLLRCLESTSELPSRPFWHRECVECPYHEVCREELEAVDDVSLVNFTSRSHQEILHHLGVHTRHDLANLDPAQCRRGGTLDSAPPVERLLADSLEHVQELVYRARSALSNHLLRKVEVEEMGCPRGDVEVDVDMESCEDRTYLWGARVRSSVHLTNLPSGYVSFVSWDPLSPELEARVFVEFWTWLEEVRAIARQSGATFRAYCFWAQAEDGAMNRALDTLGDEDLRTRVEEFRRRENGEWIDLHEVVSQHIQTDGPTGLKKLARAAGFEWRDESPSGEASLRWYREALADSPDAGTWRARLLAYNEDDCAATAALRDWLNGPARTLAHRDEWPPKSTAS